MLQKSYILFAVFELSTFELGEAAPIYDSEPILVIRRFFFKYTCYVQYKPPLHLVAFLLYSQMTPW